MKLGNCTATVIVRSKAFECVATPSSERRCKIIYNFSLEKFFYWRNSMPGCESKNENFWIAMDDQTNVVQALHPDWSSHDVKVEVASFLRPKFKLDILAKKAEENATQGCDLEIELTPDGDIRYVKYGRTLSELNERTRTLTPEQYHPEDAITNAAIREAFAQGATRVVTSYWRPGEDHRDFVVMELDRKTGKGKSKTVNVEAVIGKTFGFRDMSKQAEKLFSGLEINFPDEKVFVATDISLVRHRINTKVQSEKVQEKVEYQEINISAETLIDVISYMKELSTEIEAEFSAEMILQSIFFKKKNERILLALNTEPADADMPAESSKDLNIVWKKQAEELLHITSEQSEKLLVEVQETWTMMTDAREVVAFVNDTGVGIAAAFYAIDMMTLPDVNPDQSTDETFEVWQTMQEEKNIVSFIVDTDVGISGGVFVINKWAMVPMPEDVTEIIFLTEKESDEIFVFFSVEERPEVILESVDVVVLNDTTKFVRVIDVLPIEEQKKAIEQEKEKVEEKIVLIWEAVAAIKPDATIHAPSELVDLEPKEKKVEHFSFAFAMWIVLKLIRYHSVLETLEEFVKIDTKTPLLERIQKDKPQGLIRKETGQWILLAIIWYLAMIREQGMYSNQTPPAQKKKQKEVVIYAYAS